jgi:hypothetical protein
LLLSVEGGIEDSEIVVGGGSRLDDDQPFLARQAVETRPQASFQHVQSQTESKLELVCNDISLRNIFMRAALCLEMQQLCALTLLLFIKTLNMSRVSIVRKSGQQGGQPKESMCGRKACAEMYCI